MAGKKIGILTEINYEDKELWYPFYRLKDEGHEILTIGAQNGNIYNSKHVYPCNAEYAFNEISVSNIDGLIIPEGFAPDY